MKKKFSLLLCILFVVILITSCTAITKMITGTIIETALENKEGPGEMIDLAFDNMLSSLTNQANISNFPINNIEDYEWSRTNSSVLVDVGDPPGNTKGILTARNIIFTYEFTIEGENDSEQVINKSGELTFDINEIVYDSDNKEFISIDCENIASSDDSAPDISHISNLVSKPNYKIEVNLNNISNLNPSARTVIGFSSYNMSINNNTATMDNTVNVSANTIGAIMALNRSVLANSNTNTDSDDIGVSVVLREFLVSN